MYLFSVWTAIRSKQIFTNIIPLYTQKYDLHRQRIVLEIEVIYSTTFMSFLSTPVWNGRQTRL